MPRGYAAAVAKVSDLRPEPNLDVLRYVWNPATIRSQIAESLGPPHINVGFPRL